MYSLESARFLLWGSKSEISGWECPQLGSNGQMDLGQPGFGDTTGVDILPRVGPGILCAHPPLKESAMSNGSSSEKDLESKPRNP